MHIYLSSVRQLLVFAFISGFVSRISIVSVSFLSTVSRHLARILP